LLAWLAVCRYGWQMAPEQHQADAWNICQALALIGCLLLLAAVYQRSVFVLRAIALGLAWQIITVVTSAAYIIRPWDVPANKEQFDVWVHLPIGMFGLWLAVLLIACLAQGAGKHGPRTE